MIENLFIVWENKYGLSRDAALLANALHARRDGIKIVDVRGRSLFQRLFGKKIALRAFHFERAHRMWFSAASQHVLIPNQEHFPHKHLKRLKKIDTVFAKTRHAEQIFKALGKETFYLGFTSEDRLQPGVLKNWNRFFHLAGASVAKGTEVILALWAKHPEWPELVLVQNKKRSPDFVPHNVTLVSGYCSDEALKELQNNCGIHLCPSRAEGWGHYLVEALSCGAVVVTTDAAPMNEHVNEGCGVLLPYASTAPRHLGIYYNVDEHVLERAIEVLLLKPQDQKADMGEKARDRYLAISKAFKESVQSLLM